MSDKTTDVAIAIVGDQIGLAIAAPDVPAVAVVLTPREADRLAGRLRKAASDLRASQARQRQGATHGEALDEARRV